MSRYHTQSQSTRQSVTPTTREDRLPPRLSVILCTYNRRSMVLAALSSLRKQTLSRSLFEIIVIDNGSHDGTFESIHTYIHTYTQADQYEKDPWRVQCLSEPHNGLAYARAMGLRVATGDIAVFMDDDVLADPQLLEHLLAAYQETRADALGVQVQLRWEVPRPHWLSDELLEDLGRYYPAATRLVLSPPMSLSSHCFSVKIDVLHAIGGFSLLLNKSLSMPATLEIEELCQRLYNAGYNLWYEPAAIVAHRVTAARVKRSFFMKRAYWQGRSRILARYANTHSYRKSTTSDLLPMLRAIGKGLGHFLIYTFYYRPLLFLTGKSSPERLQAAMEQAQSWGRVIQQLCFLEHAPGHSETPPVLFVYPPHIEDDTLPLLLETLRQQAIHIKISGLHLPFFWLWRHRAQQQQPIALVHFYRPAAYPLHYRHYQRLWFQLKLLHALGIRVVVTDTGGWWQSTRTMGTMTRRNFERTLLYNSHTIITHCRHPEQLYIDKNLLRRVRYLPLPGFRGQLTPVDHQYACTQLGLPSTNGTIYLCLLYNHHEREILTLIEAYTEMKLNHQQDQTQTQSSQLLLVGVPRDKKRSLHLLQRTAHDSSIHLFPDYQSQDLPLYLSAAHSLVIPHFAIRNAGSLETALLAVSFELLVIAPDLPRFRDVIPPYSHLLYEAGSRRAMSQALLKAPQMTYQLTEQDAELLNATMGWQFYTSRLQHIYKRLLPR